MEKDSTKYIVAEEDKFTIWEVVDTVKYVGKQEIENGEKIKKIFHFNGKIIVLTVKEKMWGNFFLFNFLLNFFVYFLLNFFYFFIFLLEMK